MNNDDQKPEIVANEVDGLKDYLDDNIPTLNESIPVLNEQVEIPQDIKVSFDSSQSTETIEQQLIRTRHEHQTPAPELVSDNKLYRVEDQYEVIEEEYRPNFTFVLEQEPELHEQQLDIKSETASLRTVEKINDIDNEILLEKAWTKVEMLLMDNLPTQLAGTFLQLLNSQIDANKQLIFNELSLLDNEMFQELTDALDKNVINTSDDEGF